MKRINFLLLTLVLFSYTFVANGLGDVGDIKSLPPSSIPYGPGDVGDIKSLPIPSYSSLISNN